MSSVSIETQLCVALLHGGECPVRKRGLLEKSRDFQKRGKTGFLGIVHQAHKSSSRRLQSELNISQGKDER